MAKAPRPGLAKTRLAAEGRMSPADAAQLARAFLLDTLRACGEAGPDELVVSFTPDDARPEFERLAPSCVLAPQSAGDLGARLAAAFELAFERGARRTIAIGTDAPHVGAERLRRASKQLESADVVLGPARDGGYYLVALRAPRPELFEGIEWSSPRVLEQTLAKAARSGLSVAQLDELEDVDGPAELERLAQRLAKEPRLAPHTRAALVALSPAGATRPRGRSAP